MDIKTFINCASNMPPEIAILAKGGTGVGKSQIFKQIADNYGLELVDRRLAQMTEGDIIGLPQVSDGVTRFLPVDWLLKACEEPVALFLDEINRATVEVQHCAFQLVLDRELNGNKLHPQTRIFAAINEGSSYQVNQMGPALKRRFWIQEIVPTTEDWLAWAQGANIDKVIIEFIRNNPRHLNYDGEFEPSKVYPNPASWERLHDTLKYAQLSPSNLVKLPEGQKPEGTYSLATGFVGIEAAAAFDKYIENYEHVLQAEDILDHYEQNKKTLSNLKSDIQNDLVEKLIDNADKNTWTITQSNNACAFIKSISRELLVHFYNKIISQGNLDNSKKIHKKLATVMINTIKSSKQ
jgi:uncharacterized protein (DUF2164 family)